MLDASNGHVGGVTKPAAPPAATELDGFKGLADLLGTYRKQLLEADIPPAEVLGLLATFHQCAQPRPPAR